MSEVNHKFTISMRYDKSSDYFVVTVKLNNLHKDIDLDLEWFQAGDFTLYLELLNQVKQTLVRMQDV